MIEFLKKHKKLAILCGSIVVAVLLIAYIHALFQPGVWYLAWQEETFLYQQSDGSFSGSDLYGEYHLRIVPAEEEVDLTFSVNDTSKEYRVVTNESSDEVEIYENGILAFEGIRVALGDGNYLLQDKKGDSDEGMIIVSGNQSPSEEDLFPSYSQLYHWAVMEDCEIRGNPAILLLILFFGVVLVLDIVFPDLFFTLRYRLAVDGGEPSDFYRMSQKISRVVLVIGILVCMILGFTKG